MKTMRKIFTLVLTMTMLLSMVVTANAADSDPVPTAMTEQGRVIIKGAGAGTIYNLYRILDIAAITEKDGKPQVSYMLRSDTDDWNEFFTGTDKKAYAREYFTISNDYVKAISLENDQDAQRLAELAVEYIADKGITSDGTRDVTLSGTQTGAYRQIGMYVMISDRTVGENQELQHNVFTLLIEDKEVIEKNLPVHSISKFVREDSETLPNTDSGWVKENNAEIEQPVEFKITVDLAPGEGKYIIEDSMPNFYDLSNLQIAYSGSDDHFEEDVDYTVDTTSNYFKITLLERFRSTVEDTNFLTITYTAKLKSDAVIAGTGNPNTATLYHQNLNQTDPTKIDEDETKTYTYKMIVYKYNEAGQAMAGAKFVLKAGSSTGAELKFSQIANTEVTVTDKTDNSTTTVSAPTYVIDPDAQNPITEIETDNTGIFVLCGLDSKDFYYLVETEAPTNYLLAEPEEIQIIPSEGDSHVHEVFITNLPGVTMPETGGMGTTVFYVTGGILVLAAIALLVTKKRMNA